MLQRESFRRSHGPNNGKNNDDNTNTITITITAKPLSQQEDIETKRSRQVYRTKPMEYKIRVEVKPVGDLGTRRRGTTAFRQNHHDHHHRILFCVGTGQFSP
jgi:hypothetical protein